MHVVCKHARLRRTARKGLAPDRRLYQPSTNENAAKVAAFCVRVVRAYR